MTGYRRWPARLCRSWPWSVGGGQGLWPGVV